MYFLGLDIGSSFVKLAILDGESCSCIAQAQQPEHEFSMQSSAPGYAEQSPDMWWQAVVEGTRQLLSIHPDAKNKIAGIGISYQMHGLVTIDTKQNVLHPAIIWCDSRAAQTGDHITAVAGKEWCLQHLLNTPGNFTLSKLKWLADNKPEVYKTIDKIMLPGDYIAMRLTGEVNTTPSGLSEGILWDYLKREPAHELLDKINVKKNLIPALVPNFGDAGELSRSAAKELGLKPGIKLSYRAGDQPNNAFSLNVLESGEFATTAGTSGVIYAVTDQAAADPQQRINSFLHVSHQPQQLVGLLACINGAGRLNSWFRQLLSSIGHEVSYEQLNQLAAQSDIGSLDLVVHPFGNGAERLLNNNLLQAQFLGIDFNRHQLSHIARATQEGVAFAMALGMSLINDLGVSSNIVRVCKANMFLSDVFSSTFVNTTQTPLEFYDTNGAEGAARGAAWAGNYYSNRKDTFSALKKIHTLEPDASLTVQYQELFGRWREKIGRLLAQD